MPRATRRAPSARRPYLLRPPVSGYVAWYDASDLSTIIHAAGLVSQWNDKSPAAGNVAEATNKPQTGASINGLNALRFDGVNDVLIGTRPMTAQPYTLFAVALNYATAAAGQTVVSTTSATNVPIYRSGAVNDAIRAWANSAEMVAAGQTWGVAVPHVIAVVINGASSLIAVDGRPANTGSPGTSSPGSPSWSIGARVDLSAVWNGLIGEVIVYTSALSTSNRMAVEQYLMQKWLY